MTKITPKKKKKKNLHFFPFSYVVAVDYNKLINIYGIVPKS